MSMVKEPEVGTRSCPKCSFEAEVNVQECPACGVVIDKYRSDEDPPEPGVSGSLGVNGFEMEKLAAADGLMIKQAVERWEVFTGLETGNRYTITDNFGNVLFFAVESTGGAAEFLTRTFLKAARPFTMDVLTPQGRLVLRLDRPFRFLFPEMEVRDGNGEVLGTVTKRFALLNRIYSVGTGNGSGTYELHGPVLHPWTFHVRKDGLDCGAISKKWSGLFKEAMTDSDNFGIRFPPGLDVRLKSVLLGAVLLIDFVHFENTD